MNANKKKTQRINPEVIEVTDYSGSYSLLLSLTLFNVDAGRYFTEIEIQGFPSTVQEKLFNLARDLNELKTAKDAKDAAGGDSKN